MSAIPASAHAASSSSGPQFLFDERVRRTDIDQDFFDARAVLDQRDGVMLAPGRAVAAEIASERFLAPRHPARRDDRREGRDAAEAIGEVERHGQCAMPAHRMAGDRLAVHVDGELRGEERRKLFRDIGPHPKMLRPGLLRRIDVEARALSEIIGLVVGHILAARAGVRRDEDQSVLGAGGAIFAFVGDIGVGAGESREIPDDRQLLARFGLRRQEDGEGHVGRGRTRRMTDDELPSAVRQIFRDDFHDYGLGRCTRAQLVAVRIAHIGKMDWAQAALAQSRRVLARRSAVGDRDIMESLHLLGGVALESDGAAVGHAGGLAVDRFGNAKRAAVVAIEQARVAGRGDAVIGLVFESERAKHRIVKGFRPFEITRSDHHVTEHSQGLLKARPRGSRCLCRRCWACRWGRSVAASPRRGAPPADARCRAAR